ncbi:MAG: hypothetical protein KGH50_04535, partial [Candidatus Micrarchaeota archaeon]|nr:hypothetical protein [Candidatus Micrarchaeota archaeon]
MPNNPSRLFGTNESFKDIEINEKQGRELARKGSRAELLSAIRSIGVKPPKAFLKLNDPKYSLRREEY